jgi:hypothetical protein
MKLTPDELRITIELTKPYPYRDEDVEKQLRAQGFAKPAKGSAVLRISMEGIQSPATRWTSKGTEAFYEPARGRLSVEGRDFSDVSKAFTKLVSVNAKLQEDVVDLKVRWTELFAQIRAYASPAPLNAFQKMVSSEAATQVSAILGTKMHPFSLTLYSAGGNDISRPLNTIEDWVHLSVAPFIPNPSVYVLTFVYRKQDTEAVRKMAEGLPSSLERVLTSIGVGKK